jgi:hypothetical protein
MTSIKVNDIEYKIPTSWDDITVQQQIEISKVVERDEEFRNVHMISTYTGIDMDLIRKMNINHFKKILHIMKFLKEPIENKVIKSIIHNGEEYFIADSILAGQTQDFLSIEGLMKKYSANQVEALPYVIAVIARKNGETIDSFDIYKRAEEFRTLPYSTANNIWFFFAVIEKAYSIDTKQSLVVMDQQLELTLNYSKNLLTQLDGLTLWKKLLRVILLLYIKYIRKSWKNFLTTTQSVHSKENWKQRLMKRISKKHGRKNVK